MCAGGGGLVSSVYSDDKPFVRSLLVGIAPYHGRLTIGSSKMIGQAIPPGDLEPGPARTRDQSLLCVLFDFP